VVVAEGNQLPLFPANSHRINRHPTTRRLLRPFDTLSLQIFPVGDKNQDLLIALAISLFSDPDRRSNVGPAMLDSPDLNCLQRQEKRIVIERQWTL